MKAVFSDILYSYEPLPISKDGNRGDRRSVFPSNPSLLGSDYVPNTFFKRSVTCATGSFRIFFSSCPSM
jgi:hypothetical protein